MTRQSQTDIASPQHLRFAMFFAFILGLAVFGGCGDRVSSHGHIINENELKQINIGTTTRANILNMLGQPSFKGAFNAKKLYYSSLIMVQPIASTKKAHTRIIYIFTLNNRDILESIHLINDEDGFQIAHIDDKTPTPGDTFGILKQVFSNLKRRQVEE